MNFIASEAGAQQLPWIRGVKDVFLVSMPSNLESHIFTPERQCKNSIFVLIESSDESSSLMPASSTSYGDTSWSSLAVESGGSSDRDTSWSCLAVQAGGSSTSSWTSGFSVYRNSSTGIGTMATSRNQWQLDRDDATNSEGRDQSQLDSDDLTNSEDENQS